METKNCSNCKETKPVTEFHKSRKDGLQAYCKACRKAYRKAHYEANKDKLIAYHKAYFEANREKERARMKAYYEANKDKLIARSKAWQKANPDKLLARSKAYHKANREKLLARMKAWQKANPDKNNARNAKRRGCRLQATPPWLTADHLAEIQEWYTIAQEIQWLSEEPLEVDHIIPLQGTNVCGLHVPWNLQILPKSENIKKGNKLIKRYLRKVA